MRNSRGRVSALLLLGMVCCALWVAVPGIAADDKKPEDILAQVGSETVTRQLFEDELNAFLGRAQPQARQMLETPDGKKQFLTQLADMFVLTEEARSLKLAEKPELKSEIDEVTVSMLAQGYLQKLVEKAQVASQDVEVYYKGHEAEFKEPDRYHMHTITTATEDDAKAVKKELDGGTSFQEVAKSKSTDNFKSSGGDRGFVAENEAHPAVLEALKSLKKDEVSAPISAGPGSFQVVKFSEKETGGTMPFARVSADIEKQLASKAQTEIYEKRVEELKKEFACKVEESALEILKKPEMTPEDQAKTLLTIDGKAIPLSVLAPELERIPPFIRPHIFSGKGLQDFVDQFVARELVKRFVEKNLDQHKKDSPDAVTNAVRQVSLRHLLDEQVAKKVAVTDEDLRAFYTKNLDSFKEPAQVKAHHILVDKEDKAKELLAAIEGKKGTFEDLAKAESKCPSGQKGGDLGAFQQGQMVPEFDTVAQTAEIGKVVGPVKTQFGYHLIRVDERKPEGTQAFEAVKEQIREQLVPEKQREALKAYLESLKQKFPVTLHTDKL